MISISQALTDELESYSITPVTLITLEFPSGAGGTLRITDAPKDVTIGSNTFSSSDNLKGLSTPEAQNSVDRDQYTVAFVDVDAAMRGRFESSATGVPLTVQMVFVTSDGSLTTDVLDVYAGVSSSYRWKVENNEPVTSANFVGQLAQLSSARVVSTTPEYQSGIDSTDTCFKYVHDGVGDTVVRWGGKR